MPLFLSFTTALLLTVSHLCRGWWLIGENDATRPLNTFDPALFGADEPSTALRSFDAAPDRLHGNVCLPPTMLNGFNADPEPCFAATVEVMLVMDISSGTWTEFGKQVAVELEKVLHESAKIYPSTKVGLASFSDKPLPHTGQGHYGGFPVEKNIIDTCYQLNEPLVGFNDGDGIERVIKKLSKLGSLAGGDYEESQLEAIIRVATDPNVNWSPVTEDDHISRIIIMFTDNVGHEAHWARSHPTDPDYFAQFYLDQWNADVNCPTKPEDKTWGGFGAQKFPMIDTPAFYLKEPNGPYLDLARLVKKKMCEGGVTDGENKTLSDLYDELEWRKFPKLDPHPGDNSRNCEDVEYPSYEQVGQALVDKNIKLMVLFKAPREQPNRYTVWDWVVHTAPGMVVAHPDLLLLNDDLGNMHDCVLETLTTRVDRHDCTTSSTEATRSSSSVITSPAPTASPGDDCGPPDLEILFVMDINARHWHEETREEAVSGLTSALEKAREEYPVMRGAIAYYSDKGIPHCGAGNYGAFNLTGTPDQCYIPAPKGELIDISSERKLKKALKTMLNVDHQRGNDDMSSLWEAVLRGALDKQWTSTPKTKRIIINFGDAVGHSARDDAAGNYIRAWNKEVVCNHGKTEGGFGAMNFPPDSPGWWIDDSNSYAELQRLMQIKLCRTAEWNESRDEADYNALVARLGPSEIPYGRHPGDATKACDDVGYPSYENVAQALLSQEVSLIILFLVKDDSKALKLWREVLSFNDWDELDPVFIALDQSDYAKQIASNLPNAIHKIAPFTPCTTTTTTATAVETTTTAAFETTSLTASTETLTTSFSETGEKTASFDSTSTTTTTSETSSTADAASTETLTTSSSETGEETASLDTSSTSEASPETSDQESTSGGIIPILPDGGHSGGSTALVVAGAAGGAAGIIAAGAYALFVAPRRRLTPSQEDSVEVTTQEYEREASALVTPVDFA